MTWCILVFSPIRGDLSLEYLEEKVTEERREGPWPTAALGQVTLLASGDLVGEPTKGSSRVTVFVGLKTSCRIKVEHAGLFPLLLAQGLP